MEKWSVNSISVWLLLIFRKKTWSRRIKYKSWKNQLSMKEILRTIDLFLGKKQNGRKGTFVGTHFRLRKPFIQHIFLLIKFSRISYTGLHLCPFLFFFQMLIKYLKINFLYEWTTLSRQFFRHGFTSLFIVNPNKAGLFEGSFFWGRGSIWPPVRISRRTYLISI